MRSWSARAGCTQRGVIMVVALVALVVLMLGGAALVRSSDTSLLIAGNLAFRRDLVNQGERGLADAVRRLTTSEALRTELLRSQHSGSSNYSASQLASDAHGIPNVLTMSDADFKAAGMTASDIVDTSTRIAIRYVIDRQCVAVGAYDPETCTADPPPEKPIAGSEHSPVLELPGPPVYRISVRVTGPRQSETYLQMSVAL